MAAADGAGSPSGGAEAAARVASGRRGRGWACFLPSEPAGACVGVRLLAFALAAHPFAGVACGALEPPQSVLCLSVPGPCGRRRPSPSPRKSHATPPPPCTLQVSVRYGHDWLREELAQGLALMLCQSLPSAASGCFAQGRFPWLPGPFEVWGRESEPQTTSMCHDSPLGLLPKPLPSASWVMITVECFPSLNISGRIIAL